MSVLHDKKPMTPTEVECAAAELGLSTAMAKYFVAVQNDRLADGQDPIEAIRLSFRDTLNLSANQVLTMMLSWSRQQGDTLEHAAVESVFRLLMTQVTDHIVEDEMDDLIETVRDVAATNADN
jgi:hypothetical protein